jgi:hypothetical protein
VTIEFGDWQLRPLGKGSRCWAVYARSDGSKRGWREFGRYYDSLGGALRFCAEYELRNGEVGTAGLTDALDRYERIAQGIADALVRPELTGSGPLGHDRD